MKCGAALCVAVLLRATDASAPGPYHFAVIGDSGSGGKAPSEIGERLAEARKSWSFDSVLMLGDNVYGGGSPKDFRAKFELPFGALLGSGVRFYAALGNHDAPSGGLRPQSALSRDQPDGRGGRRGNHRKVNNPWTGSRG